MSIIYLRARVFEKKNEIFFSKTRALQRNPSPHAFRAQRETVRKYLAIICEHVLA